MGGNTTQYIRFFIFDKRPYLSQNARGPSTAIASSDGQVPTYDQSPSYGHK
jgi:hypothetical protein